MVISEMEEANKNLKKAKNIAIEALQTAENANKAKIIQCEGLDEAISPSLFNLNTS